jgi:hypothetical protein
MLKIKCRRRPKNPTPLLPKKTPRKPQGLLESTTIQLLYHFVEVFKKLYVNILLLDAMQVPTYAKYLKDILETRGACRPPRSCSL